MLNKLNFNLNKMYLKFKSQEGMGTVEVIVIIAILIIVALLFRNAITNFIKELTTAYFKTPELTPPPSN